MELIGKSTINPLVFYTGKISGYITWIVLILSLCCIESVNRIEFYRNRRNVISEISSKKINNLIRRNNYGIKDS